MINMLIDLLLPKKYSFLKIHPFIVENRVINQDIKTGDDKHKHGTVTFSDVYKKIPYQVRLTFLLLK